MEKKQVGGGFRLVLIMIFFVGSMFFLNKHKKDAIPVTHIDISNTSLRSVAGFSLDQAYRHMHSLFMSRNTDLIVKVINQSMHHFTVELIEKIITDNTFLFSPEEKMKIIFGAVANCSGKKLIQYRLLDFVTAYSGLYKNIPALLVLMRSNYVDILPVFMGWARDRQKDEKKRDLLAFFIDQALVAAINQNDYSIVESMFSKKIRIPHERACSLLWYIVEHNKSEYFVPLMVRYAQADVNYTCAGKTLLIEAVEQNNIAMVQALLDAGAVVDRVVDPVRGTALQIAIARNDRATEQMLREYGA